MTKNLGKSIFVLFLCLCMVYLPLYGKSNHVKAEVFNPFVFVDPGLFEPPQGTLSIDTFSFTCNAYDSGWTELYAHSNYTTDSGNGQVPHDENDSLWMNFSNVDFDQINSNWGEAEIEEFLEEEGFFYDEVPNNVGELGFLIHSETINILDLAIQAASLGPEGFLFIRDNMEVWFEDCISIYLGQPSLPSIMGGGIGLFNHQSSDNDMQMFSNPVWQQFGNIIKKHWLQIAGGIFQGLGLIDALREGNYQRAVYEAISLAASLTPTGAAFFLILDLLEIISTLLGFNIWCDFVAAFGIPISWTSCEPDDDPPPPPSGGGPTGLNYGDDYLFTDNPIDEYSIEYDY